MKKGSGVIDSAALPQSPAPPRLLVTLENRPATFFENATALFRRTPHDALGASIVPGQFWPDVFVKSRLPWGRFLESAVFHAAAILALWGGARLWPERSHLVEQPVFHSSDVVYYEAPEYLPPLNTGHSQARVTQKGEPALAAQPVISVPPEADNRQQTVVTPPQLKLDHDVPLPNMVEWSRVAPSIPLTATSSSMRTPKLPETAVPVVAPAPEVAEKQFRSALSVHEAVVAPPPVLKASETKRLSDINIAPSEVVAPSPTLPMDEQLAHSRGRLTTAQAVVPPPPSMPSAGAPATSGGRMIALNLHPAQPAGPVDPASGNRRGTFAATPQGKPAASGTPDIRGAGPAGNSVGPGANSKDIPPGLLVGAAPASTTNVAGNGKSKFSETPRLVADARSPRVSATPPPSNGLANAPTELERKVFGDRRLYSMTLNTPNLNSAGGSWVMHFAELNENPLDKGELIAPVATQEVSPGYPLELMRQNVQGIVTLSAEIRIDGSVGDVHILSTADERLDQYASDALSRWKFRPALKNGAPTALQAVVMIPFRPMKRSGF